MIIDRVRAGLRRARAQGKRLGRPRVSEQIEKAIRKELAKGREPAAILAKPGPLDVRAIAARYDYKTEQVSAPST
jgi:DNA invertase Pin-like site-specific DNA recombinase